MSTVRVSIKLPEDGPTLARIDELARRLRLTRDEFVSRAVVLYAEEVETQLRDERVMGQFDQLDDGAH